MGFEPVSSMVCLARPSKSSIGFFNEEVVLMFSTGLGAATATFSCSFGLASSTLHDVKEVVKQTYGTSVREQRLIVNGCHLEHAVFGESFAGMPSDNCLLGEALERALGRPASPGATINVTILRVSVEWATLLEDVSHGDVDLEKLGEDDLSNRELVCAAIQHDAMALRFAAPSLRDDFDVVLGAVRRRGQALQYASERLRGNRELVMVAMANNWRVLECASSELLSDREFMLAAVRSNGSALVYAAPELKSDRDVVLAAVERSGWALSCASEELRSDRDCVWVAVANNPAALEFAAPPLQSDAELAFLTVGAGGRRVAPCGRGVCTIM